MTTKDAFEWFKKARYEGRSEKKYKDDDIEFSGLEHVYDSSAGMRTGLALLQNFNIDSLDLDEENGYRDLTEFSVFKNFKTVRMRIALCLGGYFDSQVKISLQRE